MKYFRTRCLQTVLLALCMSAVCGTANAADNIVEVADKAGTFKTLLEAAKAAGLVHALQEEGPLTVFAPTDDAFAKLPKHTLNDLLKPENKEKLATILKYHVIAGKIAAKDALQAESAATLSGDSVSIALRDGRLAVNDANVIVNDVEASNGIIHVIDSVLLPPEKDIIDTAVAAGSFKTLATALKAADLVQTLKGKGPFTVFAPTDEAFAKLPKGTVNSLQKPENRKQLVKILTYHVLPGRVNVQDAVKAGNAKTLQGQKVAVTTVPIGVRINGAKVVTADVQASNGIIHVIDKVLLPPEKPATSFKPGADVALLPRIDPKFESSLASESNGETVSISFCNLSPKPMLVYWVMHDGTRKQWRGEIAPGTLDVCERTYQNHVWLIADEHGKTLGLYIVGDRPAVIVNTR